MLKLFENLTSIITLNNQLIIKNFSLPLVKGSFFIVTYYHHSSFRAVPIAWS